MQVRTRDPMVKQIRQTLEREYLPTHPYAKIDAYRHDTFSIFIRIIDEGFSSEDITVRGKPIWPLFRKALAPEVRQQVALLLLLAPDETETSAMNIEFERSHPCRNGMPTARSKTRRASHLPESKVRGNRKSRA